MHRLIHTPRRRQVQIRAEIDIQILILAHQPCAQVRSAHARRAPLQRIATERKRPKRILRCAERHA